MKWLHLSDLHFGKTENYNFDRMWQELPCIAEEHSGIDYLFITGDLRFAKEVGAGYPSVVEETIRRIQAVFGTGRDKTFIVPGNHDVSRGNTDKVRLIKAMIDSEAKEHEKERKRIISEFLLEDLKDTKQDFYNLRAKLSDYGGDSWNFCANMTDCSIIGLDTSVVSIQDNEQGNLILDMPRIQAVFEEADHSKPMIVLAHHPLKEIANNDRTALYNLLEKYGVILYLCGHTHHSAVKADQNQNMFVFTTGTFQHQNQDVEHPDTDVLVGELNPDGETGYVKAYRWEPRVDTWFPDLVFSYQKTQNKAKDGIYYFPKREKDKQPAYQSLADRYLRYLADQCGRADLYGAQSRNRDVTLDSIFVSPHFQKRNFDFEKTRLLSEPSGLGNAPRLLKKHPEEEISLSDLLSSASPLRAVVLSGPGGGKSTLLKYIAKILTENNPLHLFPVWLRGSDIRAYDRRLDKVLPILAAAVRNMGQQAGLDRNVWGTADYDAPSLWELTRTHMERGSALFLIDGLDEIADADLQYDFVQELKLLLEGYDRVNLLLTLRDSGFSVLESWGKKGGKGGRENWKLSKDLESVALYRLAPMAEDDVRELCGKWFAADGGGEDEALRLADTVIHQEHTNPLAGNPMMLTLMLLVRGNHEGWLPDTPVTLYAAASSLLLERLAASRNLSRVLDLEEIRYQFSFIAFSLRGTIEVSESRLAALLETLRTLREDLVFHNRNVSEEDFLQMIEDKNSPLLWDSSKNGGEERIYRFQHRIFWEYFSAYAVDRNCYEGYQIENRPLDAFLDRLEGRNWEAGTAEIILLTAFMDPIKGRMLAEDLTKRLKSASIESETYFPLKGLLLRFLTEDVRLDADTVRGILETAFRDGMTINDPIAVYYILRGRYADNLRKYFISHGEKEHGHHGGGAYWMTLLDMLSPDHEEIRDVWTYYRERIQSPSDGARLNALTALASAIWVNWSFGEEARSGSATEIYPNIPDFDPAKSIRAMLDACGEDGNRALTDELLKIAETGETSLRWHALRALYQGYICKPGDLLRDEDFPRYLRVCVAHMNEEYELPQLHWNLMVTVLPVFCRIYEDDCRDVFLHEDALGLICKKFGDCKADDRNYENLLSFFILALLGHTDSFGMDRVFRLILREQTALLNHAQLAEDFFDASFQFAECLLEAFLGYRDDWWNEAVEDYGGPDRAFTDEDEARDSGLEPIAPDGEPLNEFLKLCFCKILLPVFQYLRGNPRHKGVIKYCPALQERFGQGGADEAFDIGAALHILQD